jgi:hypothetical protein
LTGDADVLSAEVREGLEDLVGRVAALQVGKQRLDGSPSAGEHGFGSENLSALLG